ncbi:hypothetical protein GF325_06165, partial [Candidatus Bathyarchaeota archaeon]|nr:hypothetical protein [Candidatus Bathyarchaeota archaeon]
MEDQDPRENDGNQEPEEDKDLMKSTLVALGWEESNDDGRKAAEPSMKEKLRLIQENNEKLREDLARYERTEEELNRTLDTLREKIDNLETMLDGKTNLIKEKEREMQEKIERLERERQESIKALEEELAQARSVQLGSEEEESSLSESLKAENDQLKHDVAELQSKIADLKEQMESGIIDAEIDEKKDEIIEKLEAENDELQERIRELKQQVVDVIGENTALSGEIQKKLEQLSQKDDIISEIDGKNAKLNAEIEKLSLANESVKSEKEELQYRVNELENVVESQKQEILQNVSDSSEGLAQLQEAIETRDRSIDKLKGTIKELQLKMDAQALTIEELEKEKIGLKAIL